jgi:DNA repair ATPase RecN
MLARGEKWSMTFEEIEKTLKRVADSQVAHAERMDRIDRKLEQLADSHIVQAELLNRLDQKLEQLATVSGDHQLTIDQLVDVSGDHRRSLDQLLSAADHLVKVSETHTQQMLQMLEPIQNYERRLVRVEDQIALMLSALNSLLQRMDAFIQGVAKG